MRNYNNLLTENAQNEIKSMIIDAIEDGRLINENAYDVHDEIFNTDYFIIGTYEAKKWIEDNFGVFEAIDTIQTYENDRFGEGYTDLSQPEKICNMLVYIIGEELLNESEVLREKWDEELSESNLDCLKREINNNFETA